MTRTEQARLAAAINALRPDWKAQSLLTFITTHLAGRAWRDAAVALTWVAVDPDSDTPARVLEAGPWWQASRTADVPTTVNDCPAHPLAALRIDPVTAGTVCGGCWADRHGTTDELPLRRRGVPPDATVRAALVAAVRRPATPGDATASGATPVNVPAVEESPAR